MTPEDWVGVADRDCDHVSDGGPCRACIAKAIRAAVAEEREACVASCDRVYYGCKEAAAVASTPGDHERARVRAAVVKDCMAAIRARGQ